MSIYATMGQFSVFVNDEPFEVWIQGVPPHINYAWDFLPPPVDENGPIMRAVFFVLKGSKKGTDRCGQEYVDPLWMVTGEKFTKLKFTKVINKMVKEIRKRIDRGDFVENLEEKINKFTTD